MQKRQANQATNKEMCRRILEESTRVLRFQTMDDLSKRIDLATHHVVYGNALLFSDEAMFMAKQEIINGLSLGKEISPDLNVSKKTIKELDQLGAFFRKQHAGSLAIDATQMFLDNVSKKLRGKHALHQRHNCVPR